MNTHANTNEHLSNHEIRKGACEQNIQTGLVETLST